MLAINVHKKELAKTNDKALVYALSNQKPELKTCKHRNENGFCLKSNKQCVLLQTININH